MVRSPLSIIFSLITTVLMIVVVIVIVTSVLAFTGGPDPCTKGGTVPIETSDAQAAAFDAKWDQLDAALAAGAPLSITLTESEITSRANGFLRDKGGDVADIRVCIYSGSGAATGEVDLPVGSAKFKATGTVDLTGAHPVAEFDDIEVGSVPGAVIAPFESVVEDAIQELLDDIGLTHTYTVELQAGQAVISGTP